MNGYYKLIIEQLGKHGFSLKRSGKGSHEIWSNGSVTVSVPNSKSRHTANRVMQEAGIPHKF